MEDCAYASKQNEFKVLCITAGFIDTQNSGTQELEYLLSDYLAEDHDIIGFYWTVGTQVASKLTNKQLDIVIDLYSLGLSQTAIADLRGITKQTVHKQLKAVAKRIQKLVSLDKELS